MYAGPVEVVVEQTEFGIRIPPFGSVIQFENSLSSFRDAQHPPGEGKVAQAPWTSRFCGKAGKKTGESLDTKKSKYNLGSLGEAASFFKGHQGLELGNASSDHF